MLKGLLEAVGEGLGDVVEGDEVLDALQLLVQLVRPLVHPQHDRRDVTEDGGAQQSWRDRA